MRYSLLIAWREFIENARTRGFWFGVFSFPAIWVLSISLLAVFGKKAIPARTFVLVDQSGQYEGVIMGNLDRSERQRVLTEFRGHLRDHSTNAEAGVAGSLPAAMGRYLDDGNLQKLTDAAKPLLKPEAPPFLPPTPRFLRVSLPAGMATTDPITNLHAALRPYLRGTVKVDGPTGPATLFAAVLVPAELRDWAERNGAALRTNGFPISANSPPRAAIEFWSENQTDPQLRMEIDAAVNREVRRRQLVAAGVDYQLVQRIDGERLEIAAFDPQKRAGTEKVGTADSVRQVAPVAFMYLLWVGVFAISQMLLNSVIEEKSNRIIEVLLSSVTPGELMAGKLAGVAATGLTMIGAWVTSLIAVLAFFAWKLGASFAAGAAAGRGAGSAAIPTELLSTLQSTWLIPAFAVYFLLGYLLYAACILAIGSTCNTLKEAQSYMGVISIFLMIPLISVPFLIRDPNGTLATTLSWVPPYTPFVMMVRVTANPPLRDVVGTLLLLSASTIGMIWASARIFRTGILRTGQPPRFVEWIRWIRNS